MEFNCKSSKSYQDKIVKGLELEPNKPKRLFNEFEDEIIKKYYPSKGAKALGKCLKKTPNQIYHRANELGIERK